MRSLLRPCVLVVLLSAQLFCADISEASRWSKLNWLSFEGLNAQHYQPKCNHSALSTPQAQQLSFEYTRLIGAIRSSSFEEYSKFVSDGSGNILPLTKLAAKRTRNSVMQLGLATASELNSDKLCFEKFWYYMTHNGNGAQFFRGLVQEESYFTVSTSSSEDSFSTEKHFNELADQNLGTGIVASTENFLYGESIVDVFGTKKCVTIATLRIMLVTNIDGLTYPVEVRYFWSDNFKQWIPFDCFQFCTKRERVNVLY